MLLLALPRVHPRRLSYGQSCWPGGSSRNIAHQNASSAWVWRETCLPAYLLLEWRQDFSNTLGIVQGGRSTANSVARSLTGPLPHLARHNAHWRVDAWRIRRWPRSAGKSCCRGLGDLYSRLDPLSATVALLTVMMSVVGWMMAGRMTITGPKGEQRTLCIGLMTGVMAALTLLHSEAPWSSPLCERAPHPPDVPMVLTFDRFFAQAHSVDASTPAHCPARVNMVGSSLGTARYHGEVASHSSIPLLSIANHIEFKRRASHSRSIWAAISSQRRWQRYITKVLHRSSFKASASSDYHFRLVLSADSTHAETYPSTICAWSAKTTTDNLEPTTGLASMAKSQLDYAPEVAMRQVIGVTLFGCSLLASCGGDSTDATTVDDNDTSVTMDDAKSTGDIQADRDSMEPEVEEPAPVLSSLECAPTPVITGRWVRMISASPMWTVAAVSTASSGLYPAGSMKAAVVSGIPSWRDGEQCGRVRTGPL